MLGGLDESIVTILEFAGIVAFAASGSLLAVRKDFDLIGVLALGTATALGGGFVRDLVIADGTPAAFSDPRLLPTALAAAVAAAAAHRPLARWHRAMLVFDALGLGLFCVAGASVAAEAGLGALPAVLLGVVTATGGGVLRDTLAGEAPQIFRVDSTLYAVPAALGSTVTVVLHGAEAGGAIAALATAAVVITVRLIALRLGWRAPSPARVGQTSS